MRASEMFMPTLREVPAEAETISHRLLLRGGFIKKQSAGVYAYLPLGFRVLKKVWRIVQEEANRSGAIELLMPVLVSFELLQETGRDQVTVLYKTTDRTGRDFALGFTHEEVITDIVRTYVHSYRELPKTLYQIQTKFRDEPRPRAGLIRGKEFVMYDAYSFDRDDDSCAVSYGVQREAYQRMFRRMGLDVLICQAESGDIGGSYNEEFMVVADAGEDSVLKDDKTGVAANAERCDLGGSYTTADAANVPPPQIVDTPGSRTIEEVTDLLGIGPERLVKTLLLRAGDRNVAALIRGDRELNLFKLARRLGVPRVEMMGADDVRLISGAEVGYAGPIGLDGADIIADAEIAEMSDFVVGANRDDKHYLHVCHGRDFNVKSFEDIRVAVDGDIGESGGTLREVRGIEVGHIFQLGTKYSESMKALYDMQSGDSGPIVMGCYGLGIGRSMQSIAEIHHDDAGLIWPMSVAPFDVVIVVANSEDEAQASAGERLYDSVRALGVDALLDDRTERAGAKFKDADLLGIPLRVVCGRGISEGTCEVKWRSQGESIVLSVEDAADRVAAMIGEESAKYA